MPDAAPPLCNTNMSERQVRSTIAYLQRILGAYDGQDGVWVDEKFPAQGINPPGAASDPSRNTTNGLLEFSGSADNIITGVLQLNHDWKQGSDLSPHLHLIPDASAADNQRWKLEYEIVPIGSTWDGSTYSNSETITFASGSYQSTHKLVPFADWDMSDYLDDGVSICVMWKITRLANSDAADDDTTACTLVEFDIHVLRDSLGSNNEASKTFPERL